jgi:hypothetical protein
VECGSRRNEPLLLLNITSQHCTQHSDRIGAAGWHRTAPSLLAAGAVGVDAPTVAGVGPPALWVPTAWRYHPLTPSALPAGRTQASCRDEGCGC